MVKSILRVVVFLLLSIVLFAIATALRSANPASLEAVTAYKLHLLWLAAWAAYWIDRLYSPYARPHVFLDGQATDRTAKIFADSMMRRAIIFLGACILLGVGA